MSTMENHDVSDSKWFNVQSVPQSHAFSIEDRPGNDPIPACKTIPIIDLANLKTSERIDSTLQQIIKAGQEFGFFQVINHGVPKDVMNGAMEVMKELFDMPAGEVCKEADTDGWVYMGSTSHDINGVHLWRDNIKHQCHPLEFCMQFWPQKPSRYREVVASYIVEIRTLSLRILELICEGLGLGKGHLEAMSQVQFLTASNYPPCPNPGLTLGLLKHVDHSLITILFQGDTEGLQVLKDGHWIGVDLVPEAFVVNIGSQIEIISNGKLKSAEHRVVTNPNSARTTIATFINPLPHCIIEPAKCLVNESNPPLYNSMSFQEFVDASKAFGPHTDALQNGVLHVLKK
ncbi:hyoscyamine 6-dioxygenase-like [Primulina eburnea]|uniref:hyoscyamine 6-dioxygenase-like n=1 Tax=Primulina eburnea TaxID=1245227 RepID=UPI003C6C989C